MIISKKIAAKRFNCVIKLTPAAGYVPIAMYAPAAGYAATVLKLKYNRQLYANFSCDQLWYCEFFVVKHCSNNTLNNSILELKLMDNYLLLLA